PAGALRADRPRRAPARGLSDPAARAAAGGPTRGAPAPDARAPPPSLPRHGAGHLVRAPAGLPGERDRPRPLLALLLDGVRARPGGDGARDPSSMELAVRHRRGPRGHARERGGRTRMSSSRIAAFHRLSVEERRRKLA